MDDIEIMWGLCISKSQEVWITVGTRHEVYFTLILKVWKEPTMELMGGNLHQFLSCDFGRVSRPNHPTNNV